MEAWRKYSVFSLSGTFCKGESFLDRVFIDGRHRAAVAITNRAFNGLSTMA